MEFIVAPNNLQIGDVMKALLWLHGACDADPALDMFFYILDVIP